MRSMEWRIGRAAESATGATGTKFLPIPNTLGLREHTGRAARNAAFATTASFSPDETIGRSVARMMSPSPTSRCSQPGSKSNGPVRRMPSEQIQAQCCRLGGGGPIAVETEVSTLISCPESKLARSPTLREAHPHGRAPRQSARAFTDALGLPGSTVIDDQRTARALREPGISQLDTRDLDVHGACLSLLD